LDGRTEELGALPAVDPQRPSPARVYDYFLGGTHNFAADREAAEAVRTAMPELPAVMRLNRDFLGRAVTAAAAEGIDQFLDLGSGVPTAGNVHEVARQARPGARVVYVDHEPVAVVHGRRVLAGDPEADVVLADFTDPAAVLGSAPVRRLVDLARPVCLLAVAVAHFVGDNERLGRALERYREVLAPGSWLVLSHACGGGDRHQAETARRLYNSSVSPMVLRDRDELRPLVGDWPLLGAGLTTAGRWHLDRPVPDGPAATEGVAERSILVAVARKT
jgi:SAM-dependent methyltransferase